MPRPKVKPQDRQRSARACNACKASKKRCDARQPCRLCLKKGTEASCSFVPTNRDKNRLNRQLSARLAPSSAATSIESSITYSNAVLVHSSPPLEARSGQEIAASCGPEVQSDDETEDTDTEDEEHSRASVREREQGPVLLNNSYGDKVCVGNAAALSFLRFLQKTLKHYVGPSGFTDRDHSHKWFEATDHEVAGPFSDDLDDDEKTNLTRCCQEASSGFLDLYTKEELTLLITSSKVASTVNTTVPTTPRTPDRAGLACLYIMIAIGAQVRGSSKMDLMLASKYFSEGRKMSFEKMLEDPTVNLVRAFVLLAFYMLGACRRNSAFMYLGVAAKSADILGLHASPQHGHMSMFERDLRLRVAKSIRVFDTICSSILGRKGSASMIRSVDITSGDLDSKLDSSLHRDLALRANYESCAILESVVNKFVVDGALDPPSADHLLQLLGDWSQALPMSLRQRPRRGIPSHADSTHRERMIANVHVAGTYYFGIILVTRQFMIQHIMPQLGGQFKSKDKAQNGGKAPDSAEVTLVELSRACIEAATYMAQMCRDALDAGVFLGNMCIIKAWVFAAGLVLGFALLANESSDVDAREAFRGAQQVLFVLGRLSPQAEQYHKILSAFSDAIDTYRRQMSRQSHRSRLPFVEQILTYEAPTGTSAERPDAGPSGHQSPGTPRNETIICTEQRHDEETRVTDSDIAQLPTPNFNIDDMDLGQGDLPEAWYGSDLSNSMGMPRLQDWPSTEDNELMLRILWDGYTMGFDKPSLTTSSS